MKILWVCPFFPFPPDNGTRIREYYLLKELANWNDVSAFSLVQSSDELNNLGDLPDFCKNIWGILPENKIPESFFDGKRGVVDVLAGIIDPMPRHFYGPPSPNVVSELRKHIKEERFDVVVIEHLLMSNYVWQSLYTNRQPMWILSQENVESLIQKQHIDLETTPFGRLRKTVYFRSFINFEARACQLYDHVFEVSEIDRRELLKLIPSIPPEKVSLLPNGVDLSSYEFLEHTPDDDTLIYNGALTYNANYDAMQYFLAEILPIIQEQIPRIKVKITGKTKGVNLDRLKISESVIFTGYVTDIRVEIRNSTICIVPLKVGGGTRLKILEALALGTPVVTTSKGAEGLELVHGRDLLVADNPQAFAKEVVRLLMNPILREEIRQNGRKTVEKLYGTRQIAVDLHQFLEQKLKERKREM